MFYLQNIAKNDNATVLFENFGHGVGAFTISKVRDQDMIFFPAPSPPTLLTPIWRRIYDRELQNENACTAGYVENDTEFSISV